MSGRERLLRAIETLPDADLEALAVIAERLNVVMLPTDHDGAELLAAGYPASHAFAPYDDEPVTPDELERLAQGEADYAAGLSSPADQVWTRLGMGA
jgi:hypothetical protein